jgi:hypothetical protein
MWSNFVDILFRIVHGMPVLVSSGWAASILGFITFGFTELLLYMNTPKEDRTKRLKGNLFIGLLVTVFLYSILFVWSTIQTIYDEHHDSVGRWQVVVREKDSLKTELQKRDDYIRSLESRKCAICPSVQRIAPTASEPRGLTELQKTILVNDLKAGIGLKVRINSIGKLQDTHDFAEELKAVFKGWQVERNITGTLVSNMGSPTSELEFSIPQSQDHAVQIAIRAFDHAHIQYTKNVDPYAYRGGFSTEEAPALTINVRDR